MDKLASPKIILIYIFSPQATYHTPRNQGFIADLIFLSENAGAAEAPAPNGWGYLGFTDSSTWGWM